MSVKDEDQMQGLIWLSIARWRFPPYFLFQYCDEVKVYRRGAQTMDERNRKGVIRTVAMGLCVSTFQSLLGSKLCCGAVRLSQQSPNSKQMAVVQMMSSVILIIKTAYKEKVDDSPSSCTNMQPGKEATACREWKRHMVKRRKTVKI